MSSAVRGEKRGGIKWAHAYQMLEEVCVCVCLCVRAEREREREREIMKEMINEQSQEELVESGGRDKWIDR